MRILVVGEHDDVACAIVSAFLGERHAPVVAGRQEAADRLAAEPYDVVVVSTPEHLSRAQWATLRAADPRAQLLATVRGNDFSDITVRWTGLGVDGFLKLPCDSRELRARIRAAARRTNGHVLHHDDLVLHRSRQQACHAGRTISLNDKEYALLEVLVVANGAVVTAEELRARCWGLTQNATTGVVRNTIMKLRRKLGDPELISTVVGVGYRLRRCLDAQAAS